MSSSQLLEESHYRNFVFQDKMDQLLQMIQSADPTDNQSDSVELLQLEGGINLNKEKIHNKKVSLQ